MGPGGSEESERGRSGGSRKRLPVGTIRAIQKFLVREAIKSAAGRENTRENGLPAEGMRAASEKTCLKKKFLQKIRRR
jgi:hypothetical protein